MDDAIGDLPELEGDWWEQWNETSEYHGPNNAYQKLMRNWLPVQRDALYDHITRKVRGDDLETFQLMRDTGLRYHELSEEQRRYAVTSRAKREGKLLDKKDKENSFTNKYNILKAM